MNRSTRRSPGRGAAGRCRRRKASLGSHRLDGLNAGNGLFRERKAERNCTQEFAVDINRASAHTLQHSGFGERPSAEAREDDCLFWRDVFKDTEDLDLELFDAAALEHGTANAAEAWVNFFEGEEPLSHNADGAQTEAEHNAEQVADDPGDVKRLEYDYHSRLPGLPHRVWRRKSQCD